MKFIAAMVVTLVTTLTAIAQDFKGYYITNNGNKVEGYFKEGNFNEPATLLFKSGKLKKYTALNVSDIKEYGVDTSYKFVKLSVKYDTTGIYDDNITAQKDPEWSEGSVFLNVCAEAKGIVLYSYYSKGTRFYYSLDGSEPQPLVFRKYKDALGVTMVNELYKEQIFTSLKCAKLSTTDYNILSYNKTSLTDFVKKYALCRGIDSKDITIYDNQPNAGNRFDVTLYGGLRNNFFGLKNSVPEISKSSNMNWGAGIEGALTLNERGFQIFARVEYNSFSMTAESERTHIQTVIKETYEYNNAAFVIAIGPRWNFDLGSGATKLYADGGVSLLIPGGDVPHTTTNYSPNGDVIVVSNTPNLVSAAPTLTFGGGLMIGNKIGAEVRYNLGSNFFNDSKPKGMLSTLALNLRYVIL